MNWERHHIEVIRAASAGDAMRAADLLREHLANVGCDLLPPAPPPTSDSRFRSDPVFFQSVTRPFGRDVPVVPAMVQRGRPGRPDGDRQGRERRCRYQPEGRGDGRDHDLGRGP